VTDDEDEGDERRPSSSPPRATSVQRQQSWNLRPVAMALPRPPQLFMMKQLPLDLQTRTRTRHLPEGRPLPPAPVLPSPETWTALVASVASRRERAKE
jgi:hypothetical protein